MTRLEKCMAVAAATATSIQVLAAHLVLCTRLYDDTMREIKKLEATGKKRLACRQNRGHK